MAAILNQKLIWAEDFKVIFSSKNTNSVYIDWKKNHKKNPK